MYQITDNEGTQLAECDGFNILTLLCWFSMCEYALLPVALHLRNDPATEIPDREDKCCCWYALHIKKNSHTINRSASLALIAYAFRKKEHIGLHVIVPFGHFSNSTAGIRGCCSIHSPSKAMSFCQSPINTNFVDLLCDMETSLGGSWLRARFKTVTRGLINRISMGCEEPVSVLPWDSQTYHM